MPSAWDLNLKISRALKENLDISQEACQPFEREALIGYQAASDFVAWYNGHPDYRSLEFDLS